MIVKSLCLVMIVLYLVVTAMAQSAKRPVTLALKDIDGKSFRLSDYKGNVVLVNFWATWCVPCRTEIPDLISKQRQYRNQGLRIIGITYPPEKLSNVRRFARRMRMNYRVALGTKASMSVFTSSQTLPVTLLIDRDGIVRDQIEGIMFQDEFDQKVMPLLSTAREPSGGLCTKSGHTRSSLCNLCVLCASVVHYCSEKTTTETQSTQRLHREEADRDFSCKAPSGSPLTRQKPLSVKKLRLNQCSTD